MVANRGKNSRKNCERREKLLEHISTQENVAGPLQKTKPEEFTNEKTATPTTTIIRPQARTFSSKNHVESNTRAREDSTMNNTKSSAAISDWINKCWEDLFDENLFEEKEEARWSSGGGVATKVEEANREDGWCDFPIDWDLLDVTTNIDQPLV